MRTWPPELLKHYPLPAGVDAARPWWTREGFYAHRRDGLRLSVAHSERGVCTSLISATGAALPLSLGGSTVLQQGLGSSMEGVDRLVPLPHPGFRCGQVWAFDTREGLVVRALEGDSRGATNDCTERGLRFSELIALPDNPDGSRTITTLFVADEDLGLGMPVAMLLLLPAYLIADPCCPWLAPWSSMEAE